MKKSLLKWSWRKMPRKMRRFFVRLTQPSFTVSAAAVVFDDEKRILLLRHVLRVNSSGWGIPGGFLNAGEQPADALKRELMEEAGVEIVDLHLLKIRTLGHHLEIIYYCRAKNTDAKARSSEILEARWFVIDELKTQIPGVELEHINLARKISEKVQN